VRTEVRVKVGELMTADPVTVAPDTPVFEARKLMLSKHIRHLLVVESGRLVGMVTDRDIAVRAVAAGKGPETAVGEVMSRQVLFCFDDQDLDHIARSMGEARVRRLPVVDRSSNLVGILSLGDISLRHKPAAAADAVTRLSRRGGPHSQSAARMDDDLIRGEPVPESRIDVDNEADLKRWSQRWKVSTEELRRAVERVGARAEDVRQHLIGGFSPPGPSS
jgi:CBS domain-containing protein